MIGYSGPKNQFQNDVMTNDIGNIIYSAFQGRWKEYLPVYSLEAACGAFGRGMAVEPQGWAKCPPGLKPDRNMFVARVSGRSMEPRLHHGDYCVFRANVAGTRQNKIVLVQHSSIADPDTGGSYTVKKYTSKKKYAEDGAWQHEEIVLKPLNPEYDDIVIRDAEDEEFVVVGELVEKVTWDITSNKENT